MCLIQRRRRRPVPLFADFNSTAQAFRPYVAPIKMDAGLRLRPKTNTLFTPKARHGTAPENERAFRFYGPETRRHPGAGPPYAPQARSLRTNSKRPPAQPTALMLCDFHLTAQKPRPDTPKPCDGRAAPYSPCAPFTAPSISHAWASDASVASPESIRAISAGRSSADS